MSYQFDKLKYLLEKRIEIITDHEFRDNDPESHLLALKEISESIEAHHHEIRDEIPRQLQHFMDNRSYNKALEFLEKIHPN
ncbi:MAG: hypothetical protein MK172_03390 [Verrucomicrobiales bacterium]|nr:hypothetical protein [Verrucomicrobiales bacterium]